MAIVQRITLVLSFQVKQTNTGKFNWSDFLQFAVGRATSGTPLKHVVACFIAVLSRIAAISSGRHVIARSQRRRALWNLRVS